ncbi:MAG TPA: hypothetical protein VFH17_00900 [Coriobacteriia bacterium]|nr:hypothetical protein [Coriobacteriia bacterium]
MGGVSAIGAVRGLETGCRRRPPSRARHAIVLAGIAALLALGAAACPRQVLAGEAASGELLFYPCSSCHPLPEDPADRTLPNRFDGHQVELVGHDALGEGVQACLVCHDGPGRDPGRLRVLGGEFVRVGGDVPQVCRGCHAAVYGEWTAGVHGHGRPSCVAAGCHDPHSPAWIYGAPLPPFTGTGFEVRAVSERATFTPLAAVPVKAPVYTPVWLSVATAIGLAAAAASVAFMLSGRSAR